LIQTHKDEEKARTIEFELSSIGMDNDESEQRADEGWRARSRPSLREDITCRGMSPCRGGEREQCR